MKDIEKIKLLMKKALFSGNTMINHFKNMEIEINNFEELELEELAETDKELIDLLEKLEVLQEDILGL